MTMLKTLAPYEFKSRDAVENHRLDDNEQFGLRLRSGVIELLLGAGNWQALTDAGTLQVTAFSVQPRVQTVSLLEHCPHPCPPGSTPCGAHLELRSLHVSITARATDDASLALLDLDLALGEASGALLAFPLVELALFTHAEMATFDGAGVPDRDTESAVP